MLEVRIKENNMTPVAHSVWETMMFPLLFLFRRSAFLEAQTRQTDDRAASVWRVRLTTRTDLHGLFSLRLVFGAFTQCSCKTVKTVLDIRINGAEINNN